MTIYSVFEPVDGPKALAPRVVPDRFSWLAFLLPPVFLAGHRLWRALLAYVAAVLVAMAIGAVFGDDVSFWLHLLLALWLGFEAPALRRAGLKRRGYAYRTEVIASAADVAQMEWLKRQRTMSA